MRQATRSPRRSARSVFTLVMALPVTLALGLTGILSSPPAGAAVAGQLNVTLVASPTTMLAPGGTFTYTLTLTSTSTTNVTIQTVVDDKYGDLTTRAGSTCGNLKTTPLTPTGATATASCTYTGTFTGVSGASQTNVVKVDGVDSATPTPAAVTGAGGTTVLLTSIKGYTPVTPVRICDTRAKSLPLIGANQCNGNGTKQGTLGKGSITVAVTGSNGVPASAIAAVLNVTATNTTAESFLTVWPHGTGQPLASNLNWAATQTVPNLVEVAIGTIGSVDVYNNAGAADVVIDLEGYVDASAPGLFTPLAPPARICDTRAVRSDVQNNPCQGNGGMAAPLAAGATKFVQVGSSGGVPAGATAVVMNVTVTDTTGSGFLTVWPHGATKPLASNLNWVPGQTVPNRVIVPLGIGGEVDVFNSAGSTNLIIDVNGFYLAASGGSGYIPNSPARVCDTRPQSAQVAANPCNDPANGPVSPLIPGDEITLFANPGITGAVFNVTVVNTTANSYLAVFPNPTPNAYTLPPGNSDLNWRPGQVVANLTVVGSGPAHAVTFFNKNGNTDLVVDLEGNYSTTPTAGPVPTAASAVRSISVSVRHRGANKTS